MGVMRRKVQAGSSAAFSRELNAAILKASLLALLGSVTLVWTFMTPIAGVVDEPAYSIYANVVASGQGYASASVPLDIAGMGKLACFAFKPRINAHCQQNNNWESLGKQLVPVTKGQMISGYPAPWFWIVGQPSRFFAGFHALYLMRLVSWGLDMSLIALMVLFWPWRHRSSLVIAALLASTPMVGSFAGAINPNGFEIVSGLSLSGLLAALMLHPGRHSGPPLRKSMHLASIFLVMLALSVAKPWSFIHTLVITLAFLLGSAVVRLKRKRHADMTMGSGYRRPEFRWILIMLSLSLAVGYASNGTYRDAMALKGTTKGVLPLWDALYLILSNFTGYTLELIGVLGWREFGPPSFVLVLWAGAVVAFVIYALSRLLVPYRVLLLGFITGALLVIPVFSSKALGLLGGAGFQGRYVGALFCAIPFIVVAYLYLSGVPLEMSPAARVAPALVGWFFVLQVATLFWSFLRFSVGFPLVKIHVFQPFQWVPNYWFVVLMGLLLFAASSMVVRIQLRDPTSWRDQAGEIKADALTGRQ
jgi:hypothetical protein